MWISLRPNEHCEDDEQTLGKVLGEMERLDDGNLVVLKQIEVGSVCMARYFFIIKGTRHFLQV